MKLIAWNCNMCFRRKAEFLAAHAPDIVVVSECEHPDKLKFTDGAQIPTDVCWHGGNTNKGLGVFSYGDYRLRLLDVHRPAYKTILPIAVTNKDFEMTLFAVWANNPQDKQYQYVGQIWKAVNYYKKLLKEENVILAGDFNSNAIWDRPRRAFNHSHVVEFLEKRKIFSAYHRRHAQKQGNEAHPTWYMYRRRDKPYHLDYCFASENLIGKLRCVEIGSYDDWRDKSDHAPVIAEFDL